MAFDNSYNFSYTGATQDFEKKIGVKSLYIISRGAGGAGNAYSSSGGGGAYVFSNYTFLQEDISYNIKVNIGGGGKAPPLKTGGITLGGNSQSNNGGNGTTLESLSSGGGGGSTSVYYMDPCGNMVIHVVAGGGGGAGNNVNTTGGSGGRTGNYGDGTGGGQGGNTSLVIPPVFTGNAGLGGINGGVNGYKYIDSSYNNGQNYTFIGGGGGSGGTFAGGGGGAGYGGGAGGKQGGGGGGGSLSTANFISYITGNGGAGGGIGMDGINGSVQFLWNAKPLVVPTPIVNMFMLNPQHTNHSIYRAPSILPTTIFTYSTIASSNPNAVAINGDNEIYIISGDGSLYAFNNDFTFRWRYSITDYQFVGTPVIGLDDTIYISSKTNLSTKYFYALVDNVVSAGLKWKVQLQSGGNCITSPIIDISQNIYFGTDNGLIYKVNDGTVSGGIGWKYPASANSNIIVTGPPALDISNTKICYTAYNSTTSTSTINMIDLSNNINFDSLGLMWSNTISDTDISGNYLTPSIRGNDSVYVGTTKGHVYAYDISSNTADEIWNPIYVNDVSLSAIAVCPNDKIYFTSKNAFNIIDNSNGILDWKYEIDVSNHAISNNSIPTIDSSHNVYFGTRNNYLHCINPSIRKHLWQYKAGSSIQSTPVIDNYGHIFFGANDGKIYDMSGNGTEISPTTPVVAMYMLDVRHTGVSQYTGPTTQPSNVWNTPAPFVSGNLFVSPSISIGSTGILYLGSNDGYIYSINSSNGSQIWKTQVNDTNRVPFTSPNSIYTTPAIGSDGTIYIGSNEGYIYALNQDGTIKFSYNAGYPLQSSPIIDSNDAIYFGAGNRVYSIGDAGYKGYSKWLAPFDTSGNVNSSPALGQNGWLYFGSDDGFVYAVDGQSGLYKWHYDASTTLPDDEAHPIYGSPVIDSYNNVCIGNGSYMNGVLHYIDGQTGIAIWTNNYDAMIGPFYNTPAVNGDTIYLSTIAYVYAINRADGAVKWRYFNTNAYYTSPIIDANGILFFASIRARDYIEGDDESESTWSKNDGLLHSLTDNGNTYTSNWIYKISSKSRLAPPVLGSDGTIYISATDNKIYAVK